MHQYVSDQGYEIRRPMHSRGRRQYTIDYLGVNTAQMHVIRDFLQQRRLGALEFEWLHSTAFDTAQYADSTPVACYMQHTLQSGQWVWVNSSSPNTALNGFWQVERYDPVSFYLVGSTANGAGSCNVVTYLPHAVGRFSEGIAPSPTKLLGPETVNLDRYSWWSFQVIVEEVF